MSNGQAARAPMRRPLPSQPKPATVAKVAVVQKAERPATPKAPLAVAIPKVESALVRRTLSEARGYELADLYGVAQIAYNYIFNGAPELARSLLEGLCAVAPREAYFFLALGLTYDQLDERQQAFECYRRAAELDPRDPRAELNTAELFIAARDFEPARKYLQTAQLKARRNYEPLLERKASCLLAHLDRLR